MKKIYLFAAISLMFSMKTFAQAAFSVQGNFCLNNTLTFIDESVGTITNWDWDFGDGSVSNSQSPIHAYTDTGTYSVSLKISLNNGNSNIVTKVLHISAPPIVNFIADSTQVIYSSYARIFIDSSESFNPIAKYYWNFGDGSPTVSTDSGRYYYKYTEKGFYEVWHILIDNEGCTDSVSKIIEISNRYFVPNFFTPNNDTYNDEFIVTSNGETLFSIEIFSRWGNLVFKRAGHQKIVWDGHMPDGSLVKPGVYYYVINSESGNQTYDPEKGFITIFY